MTTSPTVGAQEQISYEPVIGIEIHVQLRTDSKMFCGCSTDFQEAAPNSHTCSVCLGLPGALPVINRRAVEHVLATGLALGAKVPEITRWDRKNYFYPDLPKGYQISQYDLPLAAGGSLSFDTSDGPTSVQITRAHLEEDTARLQHHSEAGRRVSLVDFNRSGTPLMEIVTEPVIHSAEVARRYAEELRLLLVTVGASEAALENGQMRVEANVSLRPVGTEAFGTRVEVKNMNSFRAVERAIEYEIERQTRALRAGESLAQETRGWDDGRGVTYLMRAKEDSDDYRYFPEPDLPPLRIDPAWLELVQAAMPELPNARRARYQTELGLSPADATLITAAAAGYFDRAVAQAADESETITPKMIANWVTGEYLRLRNAGAIVGGEPDASQLIQLMRLVRDGELSGTNAKQVYERHVRTGEPVDAVVAALGLKQISDTDALAAVIEQTLAQHESAVQDVRDGKLQALGFLTGQVMKQTRGQANPAMVGQLLRERLGLVDQG